MKHVEGFIHLKVILSNKDCELIKVRVLFTILLSQISLSHPQFSVILNRLDDII